tara:strand:+ start:663 stop:851 length:189 start_codon:yes stop_codon:yes gene_type:complete
MVLYTTGRISAFKIAPASHPPAPGVPGGKPGRPGQQSQLKGEFNFISALIIHPVPGSAPALH